MEACQLSLDLFSETLKIGDRVHIFKDGDKKLLYVGYVARFHSPTVIDVELSDLLGCVTFTKDLNGVWRKINPPHKFSFYLKVCNW